MNRIEALSETAKIFEKKLQLLRAVLYGEPYPQLAEECAELLLTRRGFQALPLNPSHPDTNRIHRCMIEMAAPALSTLRSTDMDVVDRMRVALLSRPELSVENVDLLTRTVLPGTTVPQLTEFAELCRYGGHTSKLNMCKDEIIRRAVDDPAGFVRAMDDEKGNHTFLNCYEEVLNLNLPRSVTALFSTTAAARNYTLPPKLLAHAFPDYPPGDPRVLALAATADHSVLASPNFENHYEYLVIQPYFERIPEFSRYVMCRIEDPELLWRIVYPLVGRSQAGIKNREHWQEHPFQWLIHLASYYRQGSGFSKIPLAERMSLYRKSRSYLLTLCKRAVLFGEVTDDVLDGIDSVNVISVLFDACKTASESSRQTLAQTAPAVAASVAAYEAG